MIKELGAQGEPIWAILATCLSFGIFLAVIVYLLCDRRRRHHARMGSLPLDDGTNGHG